MIPKLNHRKASDRADSTLVSLVFALPLLFTLLITTIDTGLYLANRGVVQQAARDTVRQVAIFGGSGTESQQTAIEAQYGVTNSCDRIEGAERSVNKTDVECQLLERYDNGSGLTNVIVEQVNCGPNFTASVGTTTYCDVQWNYGGIPGSSLSFMRNDEGNAPFRVNRTRVTSQSEVRTVGSVPVARN